MAALPPAAPPPNLPPLKPPSILPSDPVPPQSDNHQRPWSEVVSGRYSRISPNSQLQPSRRIAASLVRRQTGETLYVCNLPDNFNNIRLRHFFSSHGTPIDVFVPHRPNSMGRRFGFVRMKNSNDAARAISVLNGFHLEDCRLLVSFARRPLVEQHREAMEKKNVEVSSSCLNRTLLADTQLSSGKGCAAAVSSSLASKLRWHIIAVAKSEFDPDTLNQTFISEGVLNISAHPLGSRVFMISFLDEDALKAMEITSWAWLQRWFFHFIPDSPFFHRGGRFCWVSIEGLPPKLWSSDTFDHICADKGSSLQLVHPVTQSGLLLQRALLLIHTHRLEPFKSNAFITFDDFSNKVSFHEWPSDQIPIVQNSLTRYSSPGSDSSEPSWVADSEDTVSIINPIQTSFPQVKKFPQPFLSAKPRPSKFKRQLLSYPGPFSSKVLARSKSRGVLRTSSSTLHNPAVSSKPNIAPPQEPPPPDPDFSEMHPSCVDEAYRSWKICKSLGMVCQGPEDQIFKELCDMNNQSKPQTV